MVGLYMDVLLLLPGSVDKNSFGEMQTGQLISFISYITQILMSLMMLSMVFIFMVISRASIKRITEVLEEEPEIINPEANTIFQVDNGSIVFNNVSFAYSGKEDSYVLENINFSIESGKTLGIIGGTGSSKSSLVQLIPRLYDVTKGELLIAGKNVKDYDLKTLRDAVAIVLQRMYYFLEQLRKI